MLVFEVFPATRSKTNLKKQNHRESTIELCNKASKQNHLL